MVPVVLILLVVAGIAWPFLAQRGLVPAIGLLRRPTSDPDSSRPGPTTAQRQLCPQCATLNPPGRKTCVECSGIMPVDDLRQLFQGNIKEELIKEAIECGILFAIMLLAMALSDSLPVLGKIALMIVTVAFLSYRFIFRLRE